MAIKKKFIHFKKKESFQRELDAGNILNTSIVFIADAKQIYLNGTYFSENTLFNLSELLDNISGELKETDTVNEAVIKLYKMLSNDTDIIKVLVQEINDLETNITERLDTTDEVVAAALTNLNQTLEGLNIEPYTLPVASSNTLGGVKSSLDYYNTEYSTVVNCVDVDSDGRANIIVTNPNFAVTPSTEVVESNPIKVNLKPTNSSYPYYGLRAEVELNISDVARRSPNSKAVNLVTEKDLKFYLRNTSLGTRLNYSYESYTDEFPISLYISSSDTNATIYCKAQYYDGNRSLTNGLNIVQERGLKKVLESYPKLTNGLIPAQYLPSYVDDVLEFPLLAAFPTTGETGKIYVDTTENRTYRWSGTQYTEIGKSLALGETSSTAYAGDKGAANAAKVINLEENLNKAISDIAIYPFDGFTDSFDNETSKPNGTILWGPSGFKIKVNGEWITDLPNYIAPGMLGGGGGPRVDRLFRYNNVLYRFQNLSDGDTLVPAVPLATDETHGIIKVNGVTDNINKSIYTNSNGEIGLGVGSGVVTGNTRVSLTEDIGFGEVGFDNNSTKLTPTVKLYVYDGSRELGENNLNLVEEKGLHATLQNYPKLGSDNRLSVNIIPINNVFDGTAYPSKTGTSSPVITKITNTDRVLGTLTNVYVYDGSRDLISDSINLVEEKGLYSVINPIQENLDDIEADINGLDTSLVNLANVVANKVTVVEGKDLSSNDYTDADKTKLTGLREYTLATNSDIDAIING